MKQILPFILFLAIIGMASSCSSEQTENAEPVVTDTLPSLIIQIQKTSRLYTTEYHIPLPLGERKVAIPMDATLKAYIDFSDFSEKNIERHGDKITILLPDPKITLTSSKINQKEIKEYVGLTRSHFTDKELTNYEQQGRKSILDNVPNMGLIQTAQENATRVLVPMLTQMGYQEENITIAFRKNLSIQQLINSNIEKQ